MFACALGLLLICMGIFLARGIFEKTMAFFEPYGKSAMRVGALPAGEDSFGMASADMPKLQKQLGVPLAYEAAARMSLKLGESSTSVDVYGVGGDFFRFHHFSFVHGTSFLDGEEFDPVIILDDVTAWNLFGAVEVSGMRLKIGEAEFRVTGVFKTDESIVTEMVSSDVRRVYIPLKAMEQIEQNIRISSVEVCFDDATLPTEREETLKDAFAAVGKDLADFMVTDYRVKALMLPQAQDMLAFFAGLVALLRLLARVWDYSVPSVRELGTHAILSPRMLRKHRQRHLIKLCGTLLVAGMGTTVLLLLSTWEVYIPAKYMPAEIIDVKFFYNLFVDGFRRSLNAAGYTPLWWEVAMEATSRMVSSLTLWAVFGFAIATPSLALLGRKARDRSARALQAVLTCMLMLALTAGIAAIVGVGVTFSLRHALLICLYCFAGTALIKPKQSLGLYAGEAIEATPDNIETTPVIESAEEFESVPAPPEAVIRLSDDTPEGTQKGKEQP